MAFQDDTESQFEARFLKGAELLADENTATEQTRDFFLELLDDYPNSVGALMFLGHIYHELKQLDLAIKYARKATEISPISEKSSFILYNVLIGSGFRREAYHEIERFFGQSGAQVTPALYGDYVDDLAQSLDIPIHMVVDKRTLVREIIVELDYLGLM